MFWIVKHGIKDTGMSALGKHEEDEKLWRLVAFVRRIPGMSADEYQTLVRHHPGEDAHGSGHEHTQDLPSGGTGSTAEIAGR